MDKDLSATAEVEEVVEVEKSMDDTIRDALRGFEEKGVTTDTQEATPDPEEKAALLRDEAGKFAKQEAPLIPVAGTEPTVPAIPVEPLSAAPNTWKKEAAAVWDKLPAEARTEVARREADFHKGIEGYKQAAHFAQTIDKAIEPYKQTLQNLGVTPDKAIAELMAADHKMRYGTAQEKSAYFAQLAHNYGIDLGTANEQQQAIDPRTYAIEQENLRLKGQLQETVSREHDAQNATLNSEIAGFATDPKHSHFESVKGHMAALLQAGQAQSLSDAYEQAVWANPATRTAALAEQQTTARAEATQKAQLAKAAASVNTQRRPTMPTSEPIGTMDDTIRAILRSQQSA